MTKVPFEKGCFDLWLKPLISNFENLFTTKTIPAKRQSKELVNLFTFEDKIFLYC